MKKISFVIPCYNEQDSLPLLKCELTPICDMLRESYDLEIILVDDGSTDRTWQFIMDWSVEDPIVRGIMLSRNFGHQLALTCGYDHATGDAMISFDADLQDDITVIPRMIEKWEQGTDIVFAVRSQREKDTFFKRATAKLFYAIQQKICKTTAPQNCADFRLMNRSSLNALLTLRERARILRTMVGWCGFKTDTVYFERQERSAGTTKYSLKKMIDLAMDGIFSFTDLPLKIAYYFSGIFLLICLGYLVYNGYCWFFQPHKLEPGWLSLVVLITGFNALTLFCLGIMGEYISRIYNEVKQRPLYLVARKTNHPFEEK